MSNKTAPLANIDPGELELLLLSKLQDPTPTVLRKSVIGMAYGSPRKQYLHKKGPIEPSQCDSVFLSPTPYQDPPQRKESNVYKHKLIARPNFAERHLEPTKLPLTTPLQPTRPNGRCVHIVRELVLTEEAYVSDIDALASVFTVPLCDYAHSKQFRLDNMLHPLRTLVIFQHRFLHSLESVAETNTVAIAQLFSSEISGFRTYIDYSVAFHQLSNMIDGLENDTMWQKLVGKSQAQVSHFLEQYKLGLRDLLIRPFQRICKYPLFLSGLLKHNSEASDPHTHTELSRALALIKGICVGIDKEQHQGEAMRLYNAILSSYCDNQKLPASFVAKLGTITLSGLLRIHGSSANHQMAELVGCVLFKRFIIILTFGRPSQLFPQYWFPMHTMTLVDDDSTEYKYSWRLQHIKSGQYMRFSARSAREKELWQSRLNEAISVSIAMIPQQHTDRYAADRRAPARPTPVLHQTDCGSTKSLARNMRSQNNRVWYGGSGTLAQGKETEFELFFKSMTSPEIIRINTLERLHNGTPVPMATALGDSPQSRASSKYSTISSNFVRAPVQRSTKSYGSGRAEAATLSETTGIMNLKLPYQQQVQQECKCHQSDKPGVCTNCKNDRESDASASHNRGTLPVRLLCALGYMPPTK
ncbi:hypothetical protein EV175_000689 [Coemansia sp. RSA 1933]|nr:hypothetical protein EV175_000689 [Coemansia sp. RSA 1933]